MTRRKPAQSTKEASQQDSTAQFAADFLEQWQAQWRDMMAQQGLNLDALGLSGFIPLQQIGPLGLLAPFGAVAMANLKLLQELQDRVAALEAMKTKPKATRKKTST